MGFNFANMMKQAQQVQKRLQDAQKDLAATEITAQSGNGAVTVVCDGNGRFKSVKLSKEALQSDIDTETLETLEDLFTVAMKQATEDATKKMQDKMKGIIPAGVNIPGLF